MQTDALYNLTHGIYILGSNDGKRPVGSVVDAVMQVADKPLIVALSCRNNSFTKNCIEKNGLFSLSVLGQDINPFIIANFGFQSSINVDKWKGVEYLTENGLPYLKECLAVVFCKVVGTEIFESNTLFVAEVTECRSLGSGTPMTYFDYRTSFKNEVLKFLPNILNKKEKNNG